MHTRKIIKDIEHGSETAIEQFAEAYYDDVYRFLYRRLGTEAAAEDVTQEVFLKFIVNIQRYRECGKIRNYLFKLAVNAANDYFRKKRNDVILAVGAYQTFRRHQAGN